MNINEIYHTKVDISRYLLPVKRNRVVPLSEIVSEMTEKALELLDLRR